MWMIVGFLFGLLLLLGVIALLIFVAFLCIAFFLGIYEGIRRVFGRE